METVEGAGAISCDPFRVNHAGALWGASEASETAGVALFMRLGVDMFLPGHDVYRMPVAGRGLAAEARFYCPRACGLCKVPEPAADKLLQTCEDFELAPGQQAASACVHASF